MEQFKSFDEYFFEINRWIMAITIVLVAGFAWYPSEYWAGHWFNRWTLTLIVISVSIGFRFGRLHWSLVAPVALSLTSALWPMLSMPMVFNWRGFVFSSFGKSEQVEIVAQSAFTALAFLAIGIYLLLAKKDTQGNVHRICGLLFGDKLRNYL